MSWTREYDPIVAAALKAAGGSTLISRTLSKRERISKAAVGQWRRIPEKWVMPMAMLSGFTAHQLRPDLFDKNGKKIST
jgi:hypothetical protein